MFVNYSRCSPWLGVLRPLLFNVFINNMCNTDGVKSTLFADDAVFYINDIDFSNVIIRLNEFIEYSPSRLNND